MKHTLKLNNLPAIGALIGVGIGVFTRAGVIGTLIYGAGLAGIGYYVENKIVNND
jgi:hypothetical protein